MTCSEKICLVAAGLLVGAVLSAGNRLRVAFVGDPQVDNAVELCYARRSVYRELKEAEGIDLAVFLGDIVNNAPELMAPSKESMDSIPYPYFCIPGNHDDAVTFREVFGYGDTTFVMKGVRFVLMDNCTGGGYGLSEDRKVWLSEVLEQGADRTVLCTHVPLKYCKDGSLDIVEESGDILLVSGHLHRVFRNSPSAKVEEIGAGAACGSWWRGVRADGVPYALMNCGAPRGYFIVDFFKGGKYRVRYKAIGREPSEQASAGIVGNSLFVNVYGGHEDGEVSVLMKTAGRRYRLACSRTSAVAPEVMDVIDRNSRTSRQWRKEHGDEFIPLRRMPSPHLWSCLMPDCEGAGDAVIYVRYRDDNMKVKQKINIRK